MHIAIVAAIVLFITPLTSWGAGGPYNAVESKTAAAPVVSPEKRIAVRPAEQKPDAEERIATATVWLAIVTGALALFTGALWLATVLLARDARRVSERQAIDTQRSLEIAAATTVALEQVAEATRRNTALLQPMLQKQMRAYVAVDLGMPTLQNAQLRFAASAVLSNTGMARARNVSYAIRAQIVSLDEALETEFLDQELLVNDATLHPRQNFTVNAVVPDRAPDAEVADIMDGHQKRLFVWGLIRYQDVYGDEQHETRFCHNWTFWRDLEGNIRPNGFLFRVHNSAT